MEGGKFNEAGFYELPDKSFYDPIGNYFDKNGFDLTGGYYDEEGVYHPGEAAVDLEGEEMDGEEC